MPHMPGAHEVHADQARESGSRCSASRARSRAARGRRRRRRARRRAAARRRPRSAREPALGRASGRSEYVGGSPGRARRPATRPVAQRAVGLRRGEQRAHRAPGCAAQRRSDRPPPRPVHDADVHGFGGPRAERDAERERQQHRESRRPRTPPPARGGTRASAQSVSSTESRMRRGVARHSSRRCRPGERHEHVLERGAVRRELGQPEPLRASSSASSAGIASCSSRRRDASVPSVGAAPRTPGSARSAATSARRRRSSANSTTCSAPSEAISSRGRAERDDLAVVHDRHAIAQPLGLVHVVRGEQDGAAASRGSRRRRSQSWRRDCGSSPVVGSSRNSSSGSPTSAQATASRCFCPPESCPTQASALLLELARARAPRPTGGPRG